MHCTARPPFSFVQTGSEAHPASYEMGIRDKARPGRDADYSPHLGQKWVGVTLPLTLAPAWRSGTALLHFFVNITLLSIVQS
jgi:hypothetical protein